MKNSYKKDKKSLKIGFAGSHILSWFCLKTISELCKEYGDSIKIVFNVEPKKGEAYSAFNEFNNLESEYNFEHIKTNKIDSPENLKKLKKYNLDIFFIIGWHKIVSQEVIDIASYCIGMHTSLLPKDRGSAPVNWQIIRKESKGGITLFHLDIGVDTGDIIAQKKFKILETDTCKDVHEKSILGAIKMLREEWPFFKKNEIKRIPQINSHASFNKRRNVNDGKIDWNKSNIDIYSLIKATTSPYPGSFSFLNNKKLIIWVSKISHKKSLEAPGTIIESGKNLIVKTGVGCIKLTKLNFEGEPECNAELFSLLYDIKPGMIIS
ncbi:methionyl-tRNA formyltransferase [uncultured Prochlorococcus sp.]|uniref:methionyl-tRNA formyltransferase n=1 Tax=uncultured Prochlorococcus sp. TaxID=159733 RepID=UPI00258EE9A3|nr:methionyl-tRNA formyltransferase [uncultured Prochlorococcus sp.]